jgi:hypothetical protein
MVQKKVTSARLPNTLDMAATLKARVFFCGSPLDIAYRFYGLIAGEHFKLQQDLSKAPEQPK